MDPSSIHQRSTSQDNDPQEKLGQAIPGEQQNKVQNMLNKFASKYMAWPELEQISFLKIVSAKTKLKAQTIVFLTFLVTIAITLFLNIEALANVLSSLVLGFLYPTYMSFKAVRTRKQKQVTFWLIYWVLYTMIYAVYAYLGFVIRMIPYHQLIHVGLTVWLVHPKFMGVAKIYNGFLKKAFNDNEERIDEYLLAMKDRVNTILPKSEFNRMK
jgi:hypothetical protein